MNKSTDYSLIYSILFFNFNAYNKKKEMNKKLSFVLIDQLTSFLA